MPLCCRRLFRGGQKNPTAFNSIFQQKEKKCGLRMGELCPSTSMYGSVLWRFAEAEAVRVQPPGWRLHSGDLVELQAPGSSAGEVRVLHGFGGVMQPHTADILMLSTGSS